MKIIKAENYKDMSRKAANIISAQMIMKPNCVLGLATGSTPMGTYEQLIDWFHKGEQPNKVLMIANGKNKASIIKQAFRGPVTPWVPASILQMHPNFILIADEEALSDFV